MQSLLRFIINNQFVLFFFLLEIFAVALIVQNNNYQYSEYLVFSQQIAGNIGRKRETLLQYLSLKEKNQQLIVENQNLKNELEIYKDLEKDVKLVDNLLQNNRYQYIVARVLNNSVNKQYNYITIDKGSKDGIEPEMAVIAPDGVVGITSTVSDNYALVISLLNRNLKVSAKFKKNNYFGSFEWMGKNYRNAVLNEIPLHVNVEKGDTIVTSGFSILFPEGVPLATVVDYEMNSGTFFTIQLQLTTDFKRLNNIYVVKDLKKNEQLKIENTLKHD